jgi:hypothetical protein
MSDLFDLFDSVKIEIGKELTIDGYVHRIVPPNPIFMDFIRTNTANETGLSWIILKGLPQDTNFGNESELYGSIVKVRGRIIEVREGIGMEVEAYDVIVRDMQDIEDIVSAHWRDFIDVLYKDTNSSMQDSGWGSALFNPKTREIAVSRSVGNLESISCAYGCQIKVSAFYFVNLDGQITKIFLLYHQVK